MLTPEQIHQRLGLMTSSVVPAIYPEVDHYLSPLEAKLAIQGKYTPNIDPQQAKRGNRLEREAINDAAEALGLIVEPAEFVKHKNGWSGDSSDALLANPDTGEVVAIAEAKTIAMGEMWRWGIPQTDEVPERTLIQCLWHLYHRPWLDVCHVPVIFGGFAFVFDRYAVRRDDEAIGMLAQDAERWYHDYIVKDRTPDVTSSDASALGTIHPHHRYDKMEWSDELQALAEEKLRWYRMRKMATEAEDLAANRLRATLGDFGAARSDAISVVYRNSKPVETVDWQALASSLGATPELIAQYTRMRPGPRSLKVTALKKKPKKKEEAA